MKPNLEQQQQQPPPGPPSSQGYPKKRAVLLPILPTCSQKRHPQASARPSRFTPLVSSARCSVQRNPCRGRLRDDRHELITPHEPFLLARKSEHAHASVSPPSYCCACSHLVEHRKKRRARKMHGRHICTCSFQKGEREVQTHGQCV